MKNLLNQSLKRSIVNRLNYKLQTYHKQDAIGVNPYEALTQGIDKLGLGYTKTGNISNKGLKNVSLESLQKLEERTKTFNQYFGVRYDDKEQVKKAVEVEKYLNENKRYIYGATLQNMNEAVYLLENMYSTGKGNGLRNQALDDVYDAIMTIKEKEHEITPSEVFGVSERKRLGI
mgnify:CR=1 FL=1